MTEEQFCLELKHQISILNDMLNAAAHRKLLIELDIESFWALGNGVAAKALHMQILKQL